MELLTLREELETLLVDELGTYTLANGIVTPAISVRAVGELSPAGTVVRGMECIIEKQAELPVIMQYTAQRTFKRYTLYLVSWDGRDLTPASRLILEGFPQAVTASIRPLRVPEGQGPQNQLRMVLQFNPEAAP
jgi:hypothetical protein